MYMQLRSFAKSFPFALTIVMTLSATKVYADDIPLYSMPTAYEFNYEEIKMPHGVSNMGLLGGAYRFYFTPWLYAGPAVYGAANGESGGLFMLGAVAGLQQHLVGPVSATESLYLGGGGGRSSQVGGGAMVQPGVGLLYDLNQDWHLGLSYNITNFPSGQIHSKQLSLSLLFSSKWLYTQAHYAGEHLKSLEQINYHGSGLLNFSHNYLSLMAEAYKPVGSVKDSLGNPQTRAMETVGFEMGHYFTPQAFGWLRSSGAFHGAPSNGYMDALAGIGYQYPITRSWSLIGQLGAGAAGGGNVDTGGGFAWEPSLGLQYDFSQSFAARLSGGYLDTPGGKFHAAALSGNVIYYIDFAHEGTTAAPQYGDYRLQGWSAEILNQTYLHPQRENSNLSSAANLIAIQLNQSITPRFYMAYQGAGAYQGTRVGGLATGMIGPGLHTKMTDDTGWQAKAEWLVGAGGGGNLALGGGAITEPLVGLDYHFTPYLGADVSVGQLKALSSKLNTTVINAGISFNFASLNR
jgi:hypothetical protein